MLNRESVGIAGKRDRRGIALMTVIVATVIVGVLATGAVFVGIQEQRMGEGVRRVSTSFGIAEGGAVATQLHFTRRVRFRFPRRLLLAGLVYIRPFHTA
jgi:hypothetical protein